MRRFFRLCWQFLLFPLLYFPYAFVNEFFLVDWLGCGCPKVDINGNPIDTTFNANHVTLLFWGAVALAVIVLSILHSRKIKNTLLLVLFLVAAILISLTAAYCFYQSMFWN